MNIFARWGKVKLMQLMTSEIRLGRFWLISMAPNHYHESSKHSKICSTYGLLKCPFPVPFWHSIFVLAAVSDGNLAMFLAFFKRKIDSQLRDDINDEAGDADDDDVCVLVFDKLSIEKCNLLGLLRSQKCSKSGKK